MLAAGPRCFLDVAVVGHLTPTTGRPRTIVEGHTDDDGTDMTNNRLSQSRADSVKEYLVELGIPVENIDAKGFGETKPLVPNDSDANRAKNRRD